MFSACKIINNTIPISEPAVSISLLFILFWIGKKGVAEIMILSVNRLQEQSFFLFVNVGYGI